MDLQTFYSTAGGNFDEIVRQLKSEERISKYLRMFLADPSFSQLADSFSSQDCTTAFRAAHTLKGVCLNLGLGNLKNSASLLTENLRPGAFDANSASLFDKVRTDYETVISSLEEMLN
ncbi:MAG: Hpt domain-containing protein [Treponemataceae bacterium]|nr:Hpt domain-containing protein [Treponemataceae bacterium]